MGDLSEFSLSLRTALRVYPWRRVDPVPWAEPPASLAEARLALASTAGLVAAGQEPFDERLGGDFTYRVIPDDVDVATLADTHRSDSYDHGGLEADRNLAFPLDRLHELEAVGRIGGVNRRHLSFMGSITAPGRLLARTAPEAAELLVEDDVDVALLVPV